MGACWPTFQSDDAAPDLASMPSVDLMIALGPASWGQRCAESCARLPPDIAGDREAAERVKLALPETGVCNLSATPDESKCCGGPALSDVDACCVADANAKKVKPDADAGNTGKE